MICGAEKLEVERDLRGERARSDLYAAQGQMPGLHEGRGGGEACLSLQGMTMRTR